MAATLDSVVTTLNNKADIDLNNVDESKSILVDSYTNGTSFYRVYSDGWCVQGGSINGDETAAGLSCTVNLLKPYPDTHYNVQMTSNAPGVGDTSARYLYAHSINYKTEENFQVWQYTNVGLIPHFWIAFGYLS